MTSAGATGQSWLNNKHFLHPRVVVVVIVVVPRILSPYSDRRMARYTRHLTRAVARAILPSGRHGFMRGLFSGAVYLSAYLFWSPRRRDGHGASIPVDWLPERGSFDPCILWEGQGYFSCLPLIQRFPPAFCDLGPCLTSAVFLSVVFSLFGAHGSLLPLWATCYTVGIF